MRHQQELMQKFNRNTAITTNASAITAGNISKNNRWNVAKAALISLANIS
jgi:hypothetical protein